MIDFHQLEKSSTGTNGLLSFILDAINSGILILNEKRQIVFANSKAKGLLANGSNLEGKSFEELFMPEDKNILAKNIMAVAESEGEFESEVMLKTASGKGFIALVSVFSWDSTNGKRSFIVTINDISRLKGIEKALKNSERMVFLARMLDDISHQIRNPVLAIGGFSRRLLKTELEHPEYVKVILEEAKRLEMLLDELTHFLQLPKPRFSPYSAAEIVPSIISSAKEVVSQFDIHLDVKTSIQPDSLVITDMELFIKALNPVIINGCEAYDETDGDHRVDLFIKTKDTRRGGLNITVQDYGTGIRKPLLDRIFYPFFTTKTGHLGMGLTFTRRIMDELEGAILVESEFGKGTKVTLSLPGERRRDIRTKIFQDLLS